MQRGSKAYRDCRKTNKSCSETGYRFATGLYTKNNKTCV